MEEATCKKWISLCLRRRPRLLANQRGQAITEYLLVLILAFAFAHFVFFNKTYGFRGQLEKVMLRLGTYLEENLKTGTKLGNGDGRKSLEAWAGTDRWSN
jgi:hypothetical protein